MTPERFIATWKNNPLTERAGAQAYFDDLCDLLGVAKPRDPENYCFERGAKKAGGGEGWADVWKRGCFGWENKKPGRDLDSALTQLTDYALHLDNPPLLVVSARERIVIHTAFTGYLALISEGTVKEAAVHPRHVVEEAGRHRAASVIFAHNHPSSTATPSQQDHTLTRTLVQALGPLDIKVLDHIIIAGEQTFSFAREGVLPYFST